MKLNVITGATGLLGSHIAENLVARGESVRAIVRSTSDTAFLTSLGVECAVAQLNDRAALRRAMEGVAIVYHCAARVRDWGPWHLFQAETVDATRVTLDVAREAQVGRFLHVSSVFAYGHPNCGGAEIGEDQPLGQNPWVWDYYALAKAQAEQLLQQCTGPWTVVRPSTIYGRRDRAMLPRTLKALAAGRVAIVGSGANLLNLVNAADVAEGAIRAANSPAAVGRAYNLTTTGEISQREFLEVLSAELGLPPVHRHVPFRLAYWGGFLAEVIGKSIRLKRSPHFTRHTVALISRPTYFSARRALEDLDWRPTTPIQEGLRTALDWQWANTPGLPARATI